MANHLSVTKSNAIRHLHDTGQSQRQIAEALGVDRKTVRRVLAAQSPVPNEDQPPKGTTAPTGSVDSQPVVSAADPTKPPTTSAGQCGGFESVIIESLGRGLSAQRIFQDLQILHAFEGSYYSVRRFVKKLKHQTPTAFRRIELESIRGTHCGDSVSKGLPSRDVRQRPRPGYRRGGFSRWIGASRIGDLRRGQTPRWHQNLRRSSPSLPGGPSVRRPMPLRQHRWCQPRSPLRSRTIQRPADAHRPTCLQSMIL